MKLCPSIAAVFGLWLVLTCLGCQSQSWIDQMGAPQAIHLAMDELTRTETSHTWDAKRCAEVAGRFIDLAKQEPEIAPFAFYNAGAVFERCGRWDVARDAYQRSLDHDPKFHWSRVGRARIDLAQNKLTPHGARIEYETAVADSEYRNAAALLELARLAPLTEPVVGKMSEQEKNLVRATVVAPNPAGSLALTASRLFQLAQPAVKEASFRSEAGDEQRIARYRLALDALDKALQADPFHAPTRNLAGVILSSIGMWKPARLSFELALAIDRDFYEARMNLGDICRALGDRPAAEQAYREALLSKPRDKDALQSLDSVLKAEPSRQRAVR